MIRYCFYGLLCLVGALPTLHAQTVPTEPPSIRFAAMFGDRFEPGPLELFPRIEFVSDQNAYFAATGEQHAVGVRVYDANGDLVPSPTLQWTSNDPGVLSVSPQSNGAVLESIGTWQGSIDFSVEETSLGVSATGQVIMADIHPDVVQVPSEWVFSIFGDRTAEHTVTLLPNATTSAIVVGDIVLSGDYAGVAVRVTAVTIDNSGNVQITGTPAPITDVFQNFQQRVTGEPLRVRIESDNRETRVTVESVRDGKLLYDRTDSLTNVLDLLECDGNLELEENVSFATLAIDWTIAPTGDIQVSNGTIQLFEFGAVGNLSVDAEVSLNLSSSITLSGKCEPDLSSFNLGGIFVYGVMISPAVTPGINLSASASASANIGWAPFTGLQRDWTLGAGMRYVASTGWEPYAEYTAAGLEPEADGFSLGAELALGVEANAELEVDLRFCAGVCSDYTEITKATLIQASGGPYYEVSIATPISVDSPDYAGPQAAAGVRASATAGAEITLFSGTLFKYINVSETVVADLSISIFDEDFPFLDSVVTGGRECSPTCVAIPVSGGTVDLTLAKETTSTGTATFWRDDPAGGALTQIASAPFSGGEATATFDTTGLDLAPGDYKIYGRLSLDGAAYWFDNLLPMAPETDIGNFSVCSTEQCPTGVDLIRAHMVGTWDIVNDRVFTVDGPYADYDNSSCHEPFASNVYFENYFYPDGETVNIYASVPERKQAKVTLYEDGTALWRYYNIDPENWDWEERYCPVLLDPPEQWKDVGWSVQDNGVIHIGTGQVSVAVVRGHLTVDTLKEAYGHFDWSFSDPGIQSGTVDTYRLQRVHE